MRIAIYARVSTSHQVDHQTIDQQLERLTAHVRANPAEGGTLEPAPIFRDDGYSGAALARPGLHRLRDAVKGRPIERVLVTAPDRLARNYVQEQTRGSPRFQAIRTRSDVSPSIASVFGRRCRRGTATDPGSTTCLSTSWLSRSR